MPCNCGRHKGPHEHVQSGVDAESKGLVGVSLNKFIDQSSLMAWNIEEGNDSLQRIFIESPDEQQYQITSDADSEILLQVPFTNIVRIRGISIVGPSDAQAPSRVKVFCNQSIRGFSSVENLLPQEMIELAVPGYGNDVIYHLNQNFFREVSSITLFFTANFGEEKTKISFIEFYGESTDRKVRMDMATIVLYESNPNPADHRQREGPFRMSITI